jgi:hypothetical protein
MQPLRNLASLASQGHRKVVREGAAPFDKHSVGFAPKPKQVQVPVHPQMATDDRRSNPSPKENLLPSA